MGDAHDALDQPDAVSALVGITPVSKAFGKRCGVSWTCNKSFRVALTTFAANSRFASPWAVDIDDRARTPAKHHPHATRVLVRA